MENQSATSEFYTVVELSKAFDIPRSTVTKRARALEIKRTASIWLFTKSQADAIRFYDTTPGPKIKTEKNENE